MRDRSIRAHRWERDARRTIDIHTYFRAGISNAPKVIDKHVSEVMFTIRTNMLKTLRFKTFDDYLRFRKRLNATLIHNSCDTIAVGELSRRKVHMLTCNCVMSLTELSVKLFLDVSKSN